MRVVYMTRKIRESLDIRMRVSIVEILNTKETLENVDTFQIFEFKNNKMINTQEEPKLKVEIQLPYRVVEFKVWAILNLDDVLGEYWTIMYPSDY